MGSLLPLANGKREKGQLIDELRGHLLGAKHCVVLQLRGKQKNCGSNCLPSLYVQRGPDPCLSIFNDLVVNLYIGPERASPLLRSLCS